MFLNCSICNVSENCSLCEILCHMSDLYHAIFLKLQALKCMGNGSPRLVKLLAGYNLRGGEGVHLPLFSPS